MSYTKGPWKVFNNGRHWNNQAIINWQIHYGTDGECISDHVYEESDARLIASAPELLDALKYIASKSQLCLDSPSIVLDETSCDLIRNAIAKVEGTE